MKWKEMLVPNWKKILLTMILPYVLFVVAFQLTLKPNTAVIHPIGYPVYHNDPRVDTFIRSLIFASVYSIPNWIWSYPLSAFVMWKTEKRKKK